MYNLKNVIGTISFSKNHVRILVSDVKDDFNVLYHNKFQIKIFDNDYQLIDFEQAVTNLSQILSKVDKFVSTNIKRYVINFEDLSLDIEKRTIDLKGTFNKKDLWTIIKNNIKKDNCSLVYFDLINKKIDSESIELNNDLECICYFIDSKIANLTKYLCDKLKITPLLITNNSLTTNLNYENKPFDVSIDIQQDVSKINFFNNHNLIKTINYNIGARQLKEILTKYIDLDSSFQWDEYLKLIFNFYSNNQILAKNTNIFSLLKNSFCDVKKYYVTDVFNTIKDLLNNFFDKIYSNVISVELENLNKKQANINIFSNSFDVRYFTYINKNNINIDIPISNFIGATNKNINNIFGSIILYNNLVKKYNNFKYSIDPFISQKINNQNLKNEILIKFGIISTRLSAKLGG